MKLTSQLQCQSYMILSLSKALRVHRKISSLGVGALTEPPVCRNHKTMICQSDNEVHCVALFPIHVSFQNLAYNSADSLIPLKAIKQCTFLVCIDYFLFLQQHVCTWISHTVSVCRKRKRAEAFHVSRSFGKLKA